MYSRIISVNKVELKILPRATLALLTLIILPIQYLLLIFSVSIKFLTLRRNIFTPPFLIITNLLIAVPVLFSQDTIKTEITIQQAVDTAMANNLSIQNSNLQIEYAMAQRKRILNFEPVQVTYQWGQINSSEHDYYLAINQNFGSILTHAQTLRKVRLNYELELTAHEIAVRQLTAEVKSAYLFWQYQNAVTKLKAEEAGFYKKLTDIANLRYKTGDISLLQMATATSKVSEINSNYLNSLDDLALAELKFQQLLSSTQNLVPQIDDFELYEIIRQEKSTLNGDLVISYYSTKYDIAKTHEALTKSLYFPEISAGFFTQEIYHEKGLYGWQINVAVPLWINSQQAKISQSHIETKIALNEMELNQKQIAFEIENILYSLNKYFRQVRHYQTEALSQATILLNTAEAQLKLEEIDFTEFLLSISLAMQINEEYLSAVNNYNQTAVQLEMYEK